MPVGVVDVCGAVVADDPGVVDQDVDPAVIGVDLPDPVVDFNGAGHVEGAGLDDHTVLVGQLGGQLGAGGLVDLADHHRGALGGEAVCHGPAESLPGAGDQDGLAGVAVHGCLPAVAVSPRSGGGRRGGATSGRSGGGWRG